MATTFLFARLGSGIWRARAGRAGNSVASAFPHPQSWPCSFRTTSVSASASRGLPYFSASSHQPHQQCREGRLGMQCLRFVSNVTYVTIHISEATAPPRLNWLLSNGLGKRFYTISSPSRSDLFRFSSTGTVLAVAKRGRRSGFRESMEPMEAEPHTRGMASSKRKEQPRGSLWRTRSVISKETVQAVHELKRSKDDPVELTKVFQTRISRLLKMDLLATLAELQRQNQIELALQVFDIVRKEIWYKPDQFLYRAMMDALGRNRRIPELEEKFQELQDEGIKPEVPIYRELVGAYVRSHMMPEALEVHAKMVEVGCGDDFLSLKFLEMGREKEAVRIKQRRKALEKLEAELEDQRLVLLKYEVDNKTN